VADVAHIQHDLPGAMSLNSTLINGSRVIGPEPAREIVRAFLDARFLGDDAGQERHRKRVNKVLTLEKNNLSKE